MQELSQMLTIQEKTNRVLQILTDSLELRSSVRHPLINKEPDKKTGQWKTVRYTGDIEELVEFRIDIKKFTNEEIYPDEVDGIIAKINTKCGFSYHITNLAPMFNGTVQIVIEKQGKITWAQIIKNLKKYKKLEHEEAAKIIFYLDQSGDLWKEPKEKYCYPMMEQKERLKIVKYFANNKTLKYIDTKLIAITLGKNIDYLRVEINKITEKKLGVEIIEGRQGSGYRLNLNVQIKDTHKIT